MTDSVLSGIPTPLTGTDVNNLIFEYASLATRKRNEAITSSIENQRSQVNETLMLGFRGKIMELTA